MRTTKRNKRLVVACVLFIVVLFHYSWLSAPNEQELQALERARAEAAEKAREEAVLQSLVLAAQNITTTADNSVVLLYASSSFAGNLFNWLVAYKRTRSTLDGVLLVCLDKPLQDYLSRFDFHCVLDDSFINTGGLWVKRTKHILAILRTGINVMVSDLDAVWLKDILGTFNTDQRYATRNVIASRGIYPHDNPWGFTLCMGLAYYRTNPSSISYLEFALPLVIKYQDDQVGLNRALYNLAFVPHDEGGKGFGKELGYYAKTPSNGTFYLPNNSQSLEVEIVTHDMVARFCTHVTDWSLVSVGHCWWEDVNTIQVGSSYADLRTAAMRLSNLMFVNTSIDFASSPTALTTTLEAFLDSLS